MHTYRLHVWTRTGSNALLPWRFMTSSNAVAIEKRRHAIIGRR